jgi:hypothetical protein
VLGKIPLDASRLGEVNCTRMASLMSKVRSAGVATGVVPCGGQEFFVYDYGEEIIPLGRRRQESRGARLLAVAALCLGYGYVYSLIFAA